MKERYFSTQASIELEWATRQAFEIPTFERRERWGILSQGGARVGQPAGFVLKVPLNPKPGLNGPPAKQRFCNYQGSSLLFQSPRRRRPF